MNLTGEPAMTTEWIEVRKQRPPENELVDTKIDDENGVRNEQPMKLSRNLWWIRDGSMYVYYAPTHWRKRSA